LKTKGFTLIELLVVIAIIAILAAILFPVFARARAKAQQSNCLSNVKQLALGVLMYASDYDSRLPGPYDAGPPTVGWHELIVPYVKNSQIYMCPSDPVATGSARYISVQASYGLNLNIQGMRKTGIAQFGEGRMSTEYYAYPAERMMISDIAAPGSPSFYWIGGSEGRVADWHNGGSNMAYVDGHSKWMSKSAVPVFAWPMVDSASCHFWAGLDLPGT
jgi:prepilin-type N-terminal cleavage/methylation domain-containing protein/prepilin-type processing-associated H-X9-DG protein